MSNLERNTYRYYNCNPHHRRTDDCVIRAIAAGDGRPWDEVLTDLYKLMLKEGYMIGTPELYGKYLKDNGWVKQKQPTTKDGKKVRIKDFLKTFDGCAIAHAGNRHVTYLSEGYVYDIWDCSDQIIGSYWVYKGGK